VAFNRLAHCALLASLAPYNLAKAPEPSKVSESAANADPNANADAVTDTGAAGAASTPTVAPSPQLVAVVAQGIPMPPPLNGSASVQATAVPRSAAWWPLTLPSPLTPDAVLRQTGFQALSINGSLPAAWWDAGTAAALNGLNGLDALNGLNGLNGSLISGSIINSTGYFFNGTGGWGSWVPPAAEDSSVLEARNEALLRRALGLGDRAPFQLHHFASDKVRASGWP
jgi:hypothetical protein